LIIGAGRYALEELDDAVRLERSLAIAPDVLRAIDDGARLVERLAGGEEHVYGVNTGFGSLAETRVAPGDVERLQFNHVVSHAAGVGTPVRERIVRLMVLIKLLTFRTGNTGISARTVRRLADLWNAGAVPVVPEKGTVGASGDLAPLAHLALPLLGLGEAWFRGERVSGAELLRRLGWEPLRLGPKEGLALTNGVQYIDAMAVDALIGLGRLIDLADVVAALSAQAFSTSRTWFDPLYHTTTLHEERKIAAANVAWACAGGNHYALETAVRSKQDPYSFRCLPQVHGAIRQVFGFCKRTVEDEINGVSDNPLFFAEEGVVLFGGNLHGQSTAFALDFLAMAASELANISERRTYQLLSGRRGLPDFLVKNAGLNSGMMLAQYTQAALVNENKVLCTPASVDTIPTCQLQEDHVSMGGTSGYKLRTVLDNCEYVLAIELMVAAQASELTPGLRLSPVARALYEEVRAEIEPLDDDRVLSTDIERARAYVARSAAVWSERVRARA
jgi:histidine ammonia-lyase